MKVAIHQPQYLPYPGFFHKLSLADVLVVMDDVQYDKRFTNRNRILAPSDPIWITVPIVKADKFRKNSEVRINNAIPWRAEHWKRITYSYANAKWFREYADYFEGLYGREHEMLIDLDLETTKAVVGWLGLDVEVIMESELGAHGEGTERLVNVCKALGADAYVSGSGGRSYMDAGIFGVGGVGLEYQNYTPKPYRQRFGDGFVPDLSVVDMLFNAGPESRKLVWGGEDLKVPTAPRA